MKIEEGKSEDFFYVAKIFQFFVKPWTSDFKYVFRFFIYFFDQKLQPSKVGLKWPKTGKNRQNEPTFDWRKVWKIWYIFEISEQGVYRRFPRFFDHLSSIFKVFQDSNWFNWDEITMGRGVWGIFPLICTEKMIGIEASKKTFWATAQTKTF